MYIRLIGFINNNDMLYEYQFGFQKFKSTYMALDTCILLDKISEALDNGECVVGVFLDFFQGVWHGWLRYFTGENGIIWYYKKLLMIGLKVIFVTEYSMLPIMQRNQIEVP